MKDIPKIQLLCPNIECKKCKQIIDIIREIIDDLNFDLNFEIITSLEKFLDFETWILPSLFINYKYLYRGSIPQKQILKTKIKEYLTEKMLLSEL